MAIRGDTPIVTVEMRVEPLVKQMMGQMLISDEETMQMIQDECERAVREFNFEKQVRDSVKRQFQGLLADRIDNLVRHIFWDKDMEEGLKKKLAQVLLKPESE